MKEVMHYLILNVQGREKKVKISQCEMVWIIENNVGRKIRTFSNKEAL